MAEIKITGIPSSVRVPEPMSEEESAKHEATKDRILSRDHEPTGRLMCMVLLEEAKRLEREGDMAKLERMRLIALKYLNSKRCRHWFDGKLTWQVLRDQWATWRRVAEAGGAVEACHAAAVQRAGHSFIALQLRRLEKQALLELEPYAEIQADPAEKKR